MGKQNASWSSITNFFSKIFRALMSSPDLPFPITGVFTPLSSHSKPVPNHIDTRLWPTHLTMHNPSSAPYAARCFVEQVEYFKNFNGKQREYLRFRVSHASGDRACKAYVFAHHTTRTENFLDISQVASSSSPRSYSPDLAVDAEDEVVWATSGSPAYPKTFSGSCVATKTFEPEAFSVLELATLLKVATKTCPKYHILCTQCYWYCGVVWGVLGLILQTKLSDKREQGAQKPGNYHKMAVHQCSNTDAVYDANVKERERIERAERERGEELEAEIQRRCEPVQREAQRRVEEALRQANEAREAQRKAEEHKEAQRKAEEEHNQAQRKAEEEHKEALRKAEEEHKEALRKAEAAANESQLVVEELKRQVAHLSGALAAQGSSSVRSC